MLNLVYWIILSVVRYEVTSTRQCSHVNSGTVGWTSYRTFSLAAIPDTSRTFLRKRWGLRVISTCHCFPTGANFFIIFIQLKDSPLRSRHLSIYCMWGSDLVSLRIVGGSSWVPTHAWNNAERGNWGLPPAVKLESCHITFTVLVGCETQPKKVCFMLHFNVYLMYTVLILV